MKKISIIGAGTMGNGIAQVFAMNNYHVNSLRIANEEETLGINTLKDAQKASSILRKRR